MKREISVREKVSARVHQKVLKLFGYEERRSEERLNRNVYECHMKVQEILYDSICRQVSKSMKGIFQNTKLMAFPT